MSKDSREVSVSQDSDKPLPDFSRDWPKVPKEKQPEPKPVPPPPAPKKDDSGKRKPFCWD